nr:MAG: hypothetical protein A2V48_01970 [Candidatus Amesbacteria bacterium RBG_19FT_COMBO_48_16]
MPVSFIGWQSWSDCARPHRKSPPRYHSPHHKNVTQVHTPQPIRPRFPPPTGWCSWHYFGPYINEQIILDQAKASVDLNLNLDYILIDDGWTTWGDWHTPDLRRFPHGLKWLVKQIKSLGLKAGLWWAPLLAKSSSKLFHRHPDWFIPNLEGTQVSPLDTFIRHKRRVLDLENPQVAKYLKSVLDFFTDCGFKLLKSDYLYAFYFNPKFKSSQIPDSLLHQLLAVIYQLPLFSVACGCPLAPAVGVVDAMRISEDINIPHLKHLWPVNRLIHASRLRHLESNLKSRFSTRQLWHLDPDAFICHPAHGLTHHQVLRLQTLINRANGLKFLGDNLALLSPVQIHGYISPLLSYR